MTVYLSPKSVPAKNTALLSVISDVKIPPLITFLCPHTDAKLILIMYHNQPGFSR